MTCAFARRAARVLSERGEATQPRELSGKTATSNTPFTLAASLVESQSRRTFLDLDNHLAAISTLHTRVACARARNAQCCHRIQPGCTEGASDDRESLVGLRTESLLPSPYLIDVIYALPACFDGGRRYHRGPRKVGGTRKRKRVRAAANGHGKVAAGHDGFRRASDDWANSGG
ncbi:hypothetical protein K788_0002450 [Paraburkholderia caribensis MBA4]|uniref:Uncharacterized protein n=1 Tax=Paraburkholderia caribensis MBA4 TaxID=1323664 RepID=A0A0P0R9U1_9BURK|nr:hypothetical protein K788_0002450 [Paraburkholderia caribensis MBA4]